MLNRIFATTTILFLMVTSSAFYSQKAIAKVPQESSETTKSAKLISAEKLALIKELLEITQASKNLNQTIDSNIRTTLNDLVAIVLKKAPELGSDRPGMEEKFLSVVTKMATKYRDRVIKEIDANELITQVAFPIYDKYFTEAEMRDIVRFYKSPTGKKALGLMSQIFSDSISRTSEILLPKMSKIMDEVIAEDLPKALPIKK